MKKLVCLLVAMTLCLSCVALAAAAPSKTTNDMTQTTVKPVTVKKPVEAKPVDTSDFVIYLVTEDMADYQDRLDVANKEIEKLAAAQPVETYFGELVDEAGVAIDLKAKLEAEAVNVFEFYPVMAEGYSEEFGDVTAKFLFPTPYEKDQPVVVMIGMVTVNEDETQTVVWTAFDGIGVEAEETGVEEIGAVEVVLDTQTVLAIQEGIALLAVVSK